MGEKVEARIREGLKRLDGIKVSFKEVQERLTITNLLPEVSEKMQAVNNAVTALENILSPYLMGVEKMSIDDSADAIKQGDEAMKVANKATNSARITIAMKQVEVKR